MRTSIVATLAALAFKEASSHAIFQALWVDGADIGADCVRQPKSNSPVTDVSSGDIACNAGTSAVSGVCPVTAGGTVTVEMHQQPGDRGCGSEAIGGAHYGPVSVYLAKVSDATSAVGSSSAWFKIFENSWAKKSGSGPGDDDFWGTKDLTECCGKMDAMIPADLEDGDYLLRAEALALHTGGSPNGAQFYMSCYQITVSGGTGDANPDTVSLPGAYSANDPGILINIHAAVDTYIAPGPTVYAGGSTKSAGAACAGCESTCTFGTGPTIAALAGSPSDGDVVAVGDDASAAVATSAACQVEAYAQCGGADWDGCTECASGSCVEMNEYFFQCQ